MLLPSALHAQYLAYSFKANAKTGKQLYKSACAACHGNDGKGAPQSLTVFERPSSFPDFTRCDQTTAETNTAYKAVIEYGGPNRGFSQIMPAFHEALSSEEIDDIIAYLREFCSSSHWPRGELNVPRAIVTEKAYPEDEVVLSTGINANGTPGNESHIIHEQRFGVRNQIEVDVPIIFQDQDHTWYGGVGDVTLGLKRVLFSNLRSGSILSLQGGFLLPTGNHQRDFGSGTTTFEPFAAFDQIFRSNTFVQLQFGADLPFDTSKAPQSWFFNSASWPELRARALAGPLVVAHVRISGYARPGERRQDRLGRDARDAGDDQQAPARARQPGLSHSHHQYRRPTAAGHVLPAVGLGGRKLTEGMVMRRTSRLWCWSQRACCCPGDALRGGQDEQQVEFHTSDRCMACHNQLTTPNGQDVSIGLDWRSSMMANSARDPYWQASIRRETHRPRRGEARRGG